MKIFNNILAIIATINLILAFSCFFRGGYLINVNSKNREIVKEALYGQISNINNIKKITLGNGFNSGELTIYYYFFGKDTLYLSGEGTFKLAELEKYIKDNGIKLYTIGFILLGSSGIMSLYVAIYSIKNKESES